MPYSSVKGGALKLHAKAIVQRLNPPWSCAPRYGGAPPGCVAVTCVISVIK